MSKKALSESDICAKYITPALIQAGWDEGTQLRREVSFTKGRIIVRGKLVTRGKAKRADYVLYYQHIPIALIEAKDNTCAVGDVVKIVEARPMSKRKRWEVVSDAAPAAAGA